MKQVNIHDAKTHLSRLVDQAAKGEPFIIAKAGRPLVRVVPLEDADVAKTEKRKPSRLGSLAGRFTVPDDFDRLAEDEIRRMFEGDD